MGESLIKTRRVFVVMNVAGRDSNDIDRFITEVEPMMRRLGGTRLLIGDVRVESEMAVNG